MREPSLLAYTSTTSHNLWQLAQRFDRVFRLSSSRRARESGRSSDGLRCTDNLQHCRGWCHGGAYIILPAALADLSARQTTRCPFARAGLALRLFWDTSWFIVPRGNWVKVKFIDVSVRSYPIFRRDNWHQRWLARLVLPLVFEILSHRITIGSERENVCLPRRKTLLISDAIRTLQMKALQIGSDPAQFITEWP